MSRLVHGMNVFAVQSRACVEAHYFVSLMRKLEAFHGVQILTWSLMRNHFHILIREPLKRLENLSDEELVERVRKLNGKSAGLQLKWQLDHLRKFLKSDAAADQLKQCYLSRMGNVSFFVKELKGRFTQWYNKRHDRFGTLWSDRFKSVLVQDGAATRTMAAYIDLNCVRAGIVSDPKDYRWCGYSEAVAGGSKLAREGLMQVYAPNEGNAWGPIARTYRKFLFSAGEQRIAEPGKAVRRGIPQERVRQVLDGNGELSLAELIHCRVRYFANGLALGSAEFVEQTVRNNRKHIVRKRKVVANRVTVSEGEFHTLRRVRGEPFETVLPV